MKKFSNIFLLVFLVVLASCEDPISVDLNDAPPRLVIEASINWEKGTQGNEQSIKLSTSSPFFDTTTNTAVSGAQVTVLNENTGAIFVFEDQNDGTYTTSTFVPVLNDSYALEVLYEGETYFARETFMPVASINRVEQGLEGGFDDDVIDLTVYFDDPAGEENYYFSTLFRAGDPFVELESISDEFINGNEVFIIYEKDDEDDDLEPFLPGDEVQVELLGISQRYYNFVELLIEQYYGGGDPFSSTPAEIRGNCSNLTNEANYAFGYFRLSELDVITYTVE